MRAILILFVLLAPGVLAGNADEYSGAFQDHTGYNTQKKMARAADGVLYRVHVEPTSEPNITRLVVLREKDGNVETLPSPTAARGDTARPSLVVDSRGTLHLAWTERAEDDREVFWAWFDGRAWRGATQLSTGKGYAGFPSLAVDADDDLHVAWYGFDGTNYQTYYRAWDGASWSPPTQLSSGNLDANNPSVVVDPEGGVHVAWYKDDGRKYRIWYAYQAPGADAFDLPRAISQGEGDAFNAALAVDAAGVVHAAWDELHDDGYRIMHRTLPDGGSRVLASGLDGGEYPAIAAWNGTVLVAWATFDGRLLAATPEGAPAPLLGGERGRLPSLRGASPFPRADGDATLDVLWTREGEVHHVAVGAGCSPFEACASAPSRPKDTPAGWFALVVAAAAGAAASRRQRGRI